MNPSQFYTRLEKMLEARYPIIFIETHEYERAYGHLKHLILQSKANYQLLLWNQIDGLKLWEKGSKDAYQEIGEAVTASESVFTEVQKRLKGTSANEIYVLDSAHDFLEEANAKAWIRKLADEFKYARGRRHLILLSPILALPREIEKYVTVLEMPLPDKEALGRILNQVANDCKTAISEGTREQLVNAALGMTEQEADLAFCLAWAERKLDHESHVVVNKEKEQIIKKSGMLEFFQPHQGLKDVGGLENLKKWLDQRGMAFSSGAKTFHLAEPKGILMLGVPGCGKSLTAKAIASKWNMPLLRLDIGKVFEGIVGSSEHNIRAAIRTAEAVAPCILWIDEIEKGLAGTGSSGSTDSGVSSRVFSTLLTWMQEKSSPVFTVATANGVEHLPPELLRKGRFDGIFFVDLPTEAERAEIFKIHLEKRGQDSNKLSVGLLANKSVGFIGSEIEEAVNDALFNAYAENPGAPKLEVKHLVGAIEATVLLATTMRERIEFLRNWAKNRTLRAGLENTEAIPERTVALTPLERKRNRSLDFQGGQA